MSSFIHTGYPLATSVVQLPAGAGSVPTHACSAVIRQRSPTDPIGTTTVTFDGVNAGSEIRVYLPGGVEAAGIESCATDQVLTWSVYAPGSPNNTATVRIVHPNYKIKEFDYTASTGATSLSVQQEIDKWYSNP